MLRKYAQKICKYTQNLMLLKINLLCLVLKIKNVVFKAHLEDHAKKIRCIMAYAQKSIPIYFNNVILFQKY